MSTDTRHPHYDDTTLQAAIDNVCVEICEKFSLGSLALTSTLQEARWVSESGARLALAKAFLGHLPEPTPPVVDGKTPAHVAFNAMVSSFKLGENAFVKWEDLSAEEKAVREIGASAVLAAFGNKQASQIHKSLEEIIGTKCLPSQMPRFVGEAIASAGQASLDAAIARMEAAPIDGLWVSFNENGGVGYDNSLKSVRARLIDAARGPINLEAAVGATPGSFAKTCDDPKTGELPMSEIQWTEWHGGECPLKDEEVEEWEWKLRDGYQTHKCTQSYNMPSGRRWTNEGAATDIIAYRVLKWRAGCGPDAVAKPIDWESLATKWEHEATLQLTRAEKVEEEAATERRKRLYAEEHLGVLAKTFGYEGRTWSNMVSYLCPRLLKAEAELADWHKATAWTKTALCPSPDMKPCELVAKEGQP